MRYGRRRWSGWRRISSDLRMLAAVLGAAGIVACSHSIGDAPAANVIEIAPFSASIDVGGSVSLFASVLDVRGRVITSNAAITWTSSVPTIATVDAQGKVTGVSPGSARITAQQGRVAGAASITVRIPVPARVEIPVPTTTMSRGDTVRLSARALSEAGSAYSGRGFTWSSNSPSVATVTPSVDSSTALVTAMSPGTAVISASNLGVAGSSNVVVSPDPVIAFPAGIVAFQGTSGGNDPAPQQVEIANGGGGTLRGLSVASIEYPQGANGWLQATINTLAAGPRLALGVVTRGLAIGSYSATVTVASTAPAVVPQSLTVTLSVTPPPFLTLSSTVVSFGAASGGAGPAPQVLAITNTGGGTLSGLTVSAPATPGGQPAPWLSASLSGTTAPASLTLRANATGLAIGSYAARFAVSAAGAGGSPRTVDVTLVVSQNATIIVTPASLSFTAVQGANPAAAIVAVSNGGGGSLTGLSLGAAQYGAGGPSGWLVATLDVAQAPAQVTVAPSSAALPAGTYSATFPVQSSLTGVVPAVVSVTLTVRTAGQIVVTSSNVVITATAASSNPRSVIGISNGGSGALSGLTAVTSYAPSQATGWLTTTFAAGVTTAPTSLSMQVRSTTLAVGSYDATVQLSSPDAPTTVDVAVTLVVSGQLQPGAPTVTLFGALGVGSSGTDATSISNAGAGFIDGLSSSVTYSGASGWLSHALTGTTTPTNLLTQASPDASAPRGTAAATITLRGNNVAPVTVSVIREIGYTYERHIYTGATNTFASIGCTGCHNPGSRPIPFTSYDQLVSGGWINPASRNPASSYVYSHPASGAHGGPQYSPTPGSPFERLRDWISDGSRRR